ncbi:MAG: hypothetical protein CMD78_07595 [Gammaproteobacteria bacterium]|nr:hypothetical protein [Gammaproteobacteria bacterium]|tara:strand:- start:861 stop:1721 length:861 start_codon:yes stop_codon:yes gene_type:complete
MGFIGAAIVKNMFWQNFKKIIVFVAVFNLSACSVVGDLWYERIDQFIANQLLEYANFSNAQEGYIRKVAKEFKDWNAKNELPEYKKLLLQFRFLGEETVVSDIDGIYQEGVFLSNRNRDFFTSHFIDFSKTLTEKQIKEISIHLDLLTEERIFELKKETNNYQDTLGKTFVRFFRLMGVKLNKEQKDTIQFSSSRLEDRRIQLINDRINWNQEFVKILASRNDQNFEQQLTSHINALNPEDKYTRKVINQITAEIIASFNEKQRARFQKRLGVFENTIDRLIAKNN